MSIKIQRLRILVDGIVQGVGFRPFVYNLANQLNLSGFVANSSNGVEIEIEGTKKATDLFLSRLKTNAPPLADIQSLESRDIPVTNSAGFEIKTSQSGTDNQTIISPDISICQDCLTELIDPSDRRYLYPFINCTNCGPRFTIIKNIPYDRPATTMDEFKMCLDCQREYNEPSNRRFHAQPNACPDCGPEVWLESANQNSSLCSHDEAISQTVKHLIDGRIVAIKGLGGFHLAVDATNEDAINRLRERKNREEKPLAVMIANEDELTNYVFSSTEEVNSLKSPQRPIVLLQKKDKSQIAHSVAPGNRRLGVMFPYTPLHYVLFQRLQELDPGNNHVLVMTSANLSEEPIAISNDEARRRLINIADYFLMHDRDILIRGDDSVLMMDGKDTVFLRRSRGYVPRPVFLKNEGPPVLAVGGELKNTSCLFKRDRAFLSQHVGDLENLEANRFFEATIDHIQKILECNPQVLACDMHPAYFSTQWAKRQKNISLVEVQHHHAHMASVMAEKKLDHPVIGIILDGTGYGYDKTIWGGEILLGDFTSIKRFAWLEPVALPGGDSAIRAPWKTAIAHLKNAYGDDLPAIKLLKKYPVSTVVEMIDKKLNTPVTSSCGRLFDAVAAIAGGRTEIKYEAQAAIELMQAVESIPQEGYDIDILPPTIDLKMLIKQVVLDLENGQSFSKIAGRFHRTVVDIFVQVALAARDASGIKDIVLSGGVFQNEIINREMFVSFKDKGFNVHRHSLVPANDGGLSLGQAAIAQQLVLQGREKVAYQTN